MLYLGYAPDPRGAGRGLRTLIGILLYKCVFSVNCNIAIKSNKKKIIGVVGEEKIKVFSENPQGLL